MKLGRIYKMQEGRFPFDCPYGIYCGKAGNGFLQFVWNGKNLAMNGGNFEEVIFTVDGMTIIPEIDDAE